MYDKYPRQLNSTVVLRNAIKKKATKYGSLGRPYIIAVNVDAMGIDRITEMEALFGNETFIISSNDAEMIREKNGAWYGPKGPCNTRVSGVWIFDNLYEWGLHKRHTLYINPYSTERIPSEIYRNLPYARIYGSKMRWYSGKSIKDILNIDWEWLY